MPNNSICALLVFSITYIIWLIIVLLELLKHYDESYVVENVHKNPKFVKLYAYRGQKIVKKFNHILDDAVITIKKINEKSILHHTASAGMVFPTVRTEVRDCPVIGMERY